MFFGSLPELFKRHQRMVWYKPLSKVIYSKEKRERTVNIICSGFTFLFIGGLELKRNPVGD